jgi:hypothetical protein
VIDDNSPDMNPLGTKLVLERSKTMDSVGMSNAPKTVPDDNALSRKQMSGILYASLAMSILVIVGLAAFAVYYFVVKKNDGSQSQANASPGPNAAAAASGSVFAQDPVTKRFWVAPHNIT